MEYYEVTFKLPRPNRSWFRYRLRSLLTLMLLVAVAVTLWRLYATSNRYELLQKLEQSKAARDEALQTWKRVAAAGRQGDDDGKLTEAKARADYFRHRADVKALFKTIQDNGDNALSAR